jgi:hypothetical protein
MHIRSLTLLAILALVAAACDGGETGDASTTSASEETTTTTAPEPEFEAMQLTYALEAGASYSYEVAVDQTIDLTTTGDTTALGEGEELPGEMSLTVTGTSTFNHTVSDGPEPGTFEINIVGDFTDLEFGGTVDGEPVDEAEIPDLAEMEPVDTTIVVDEQGNVIPGSSDDLGADLLGGMGGLDMLDQFGAAAGTGQFVGPPLTEDEVTVGDTWSETIEIPAMPDADPITTQIDSEVVGTDTVDGAAVLVIDTTTTTSPIEFDLAQLLIGFMTAFMPEDATEEERAEIDALVDQLRFAFSIDESVADMTTWFDHEAGLSRQAEVSGDTNMVMDINIPDETTGELVEFAMDMAVSQNVTYRLVDSSDT